MQQADIEQFVLEVTGAHGISRIDNVQRLWSGYGKILRMGLDEPGPGSVVVKHVQPGNGKHPRGWDTGLSHQRKLKSYQVETHWYSLRKDWGRNRQARIPACLGAKTMGDEVLLVLEDLDAAGFSGRRNSVNQSEWKACVRWLAAFHRENLGASAEGLWESGTYWHLETRPDELAALDDLPLKLAAPAIDAKLKGARLKTLVHGDAKLANFCFASKGADVAAVDFQYIGAGCGMKDLAYFVGSCFRDEQAERMEEEVLDYYFHDAPEGLEEDWRPLYKVAWADFHRFLKGWSPGHWKLSGYSERVVQEVIASLE